MDVNTNVFETLSKINVNNFVQNKNNFKYLSWSDAVNTLLKHYPNARWVVREWDGVPYLASPAGCFVEVSVIINDIERKQLHPILDFRNKPILKPDAFQVNASIQRALAKAISLHGLGLYIYQGEDLPMSEKEAIDEMRLELTVLLKKNKKYNQQAHIAMMKMDVDQLQEKIEEYK